MGDMTVGATNACNVAMPKTVGDGDGNVAMPKKVCDAHGPTWYYYQRCKDHVHHPKEAKAAPKDPVGCEASKEAPKEQELRHKHVDIAVQWPPKKSMMKSQGCIPTHQRTIRQNV
eukprot:41267_1